MGSQRKHGTGQTDSNPLKRQPQDCPTQGQPVGKLNKQHFGSVGGVGKRFKVVEEGFRLWIVNVPPIVSSVSMAYYEDDDPADGLIVPHMVGIESKVARALVSVQLK